MHPYDVFEKLPDDRKEKILQACMEVFAEQGYNGASTNDIVKRAGISKGILFHYFGNKKKLYLYLLDKTLDRVLEKFKTAYAAATDDLFERITLSGVIKLRLSLEEPLVYRLIFGTFINTPAELAEDVGLRLKRLSDTAMPMLLDGLDVSKVRSGMDPKKAIEVVLLLMDGLQAKYLEAFRNMQPDQALSLTDRLAEESKVYMEILKKGIYDTI